VYRYRAECASIDPEAFDHLFHQVRRTYLHLISLNITKQIAWRSEKRSTRTPEWIPRMQPPSQRRTGIKMAQIGERIERSESLPGPTGRFDGFVPLMFHPSALLSTLSPFRPFATVACKYERSFIPTESNSPNNVFLPPCPDARSARRRFPSVRECTAIPFLRAVDCGKREAAGVDDEKGRAVWKRERMREESPPTINVYGAAPSFFPFYVVS